MNNYQWFALVRYFMEVRWNPKRQNEWKCGCGSSKWRWSKSWFDPLRAWVQRIQSGPRMGKSLEFRTSKNLEIHRDPIPGLESIMFDVQVMSPHFLSHLSSPKSTQMDSNSRIPMGFLGWTPGNAQKRQDAEYETWLDKKPINFCWASWIKMLRFVGFLGFSIVFFWRGETDVLLERVRWNGWS